KSEPAFRIHLAFVAFQDRLRWQLGGIELIGGQDETTLLVNAGLAGREGRGQGPVDLVEHLVGWRPVSGASPFAIAGYNAHRARGEKRGLQVLLEGHKRLTRIRFARKGSTA